MVGIEPGTLAVTVGPHAAGFAGVDCKDLGSGGLSVVGGDPNDCEWIDLELRSGASGFSGALRGVTWLVTRYPQWTVNADRSGTFVGTDATSGTVVSGTFACL